MKETKKTAKRTKMAAVSMALAAMMAGQTVVVMAGESDSKCTVYISVDRWNRD